MGSQKIRHNLAIEQQQRGDKSSLQCSDSSLYSHLLLPYLGLASPSCVCVCVCEFSLDWPLSLSFSTFLFILEAEVRILPNRKLLLDFSIAPVLSCLFNQMKT